MHDNALSHVFKLNCEFFEHKRFTGEKIREWSPLSPDLNPIKKSMVSCEDKGGKQYNSKADLCKAIKTTISEIEPTEINQINGL